MLTTLKHLLNSIAPDSHADASRSDERTVQLAAAVLLVEVMRSDAELAAAERQVIVAALRDRFELGDEALDRLLHRAGQTAAHASDTFAFTSRINDAFTMEEKIDLVEQMWRVAFADGTIDENENHLMRKVAGLLYIPQGAYVHAKMRARESTEGSNPRLTDL